MSGSLRYTPQSGRSRRAAKPAARQDSPAPKKEEAKPQLPPAQSPRQRNVEPVLSLGATRYVMVRSLGTLAVPPVPFKVGQRVMALYIEALNAAKEVALYGDKKMQAQYFKCMIALSRLLWKHIRPVGTWRVLMWRLGLLKNPLFNCSEQELRDITDFFLQGRTRSSVLPMSESEERNRA